MANKHWKVYYPNIIDVSTAQMLFGQEMNDVALALSSEYVAVDPDLVNGSILAVEVDDRPLINQMQDALRKDMEQRINQGYNLSRVFRY